MKMNKKGFTLIEMLVVIAIIAVLVSIVIPVVGNSTEKAKEAKDAANIRSAIAEVTTKALAGETGATKPVDLTNDGGFTTLSEMADIGGFPKTMFDGSDVTVAYCSKHNCVVINNVDADGHTHVPGDSCTWTPTP